MEHWELINNGSVVVSVDAEGLWRNAAAYFQWCDEHPIVSSKTLLSGKEAGKKVNTEQPRPYSVKALCLHCGLLEEHLRDIRATKDKSSQYYIVVSRILYIIYTQNLEHGITGTYNPVMVSRVLNLEKDDTPTSAIKIEVVGGLPELSKSENEILEKLESEIALREKDKEEFS